MPFDRSSKEEIIQFLWKEDEPICGKISECQSVNTQTHAYHDIL